MHTAIKSVTRPLLIVVATVAIGFGPASSFGQCVENGGTQVCSVFPRKPYTYSLCDEAAAYLARIQAWCKARGGVPQPDGSCPGATPDTEGNLDSRSVAFAQYLYPAKSCSETYDTGWGQTFFSNFCLSGSPAYDSDGYLKTDFRRIGVTCVQDGQPPVNETISAFKSGFAEVSCSNGGSGLSQILGPWGWTCTGKNESCGTGSCGVGTPPPGVGNPITPAVGIKVLAETDYRHAKGLTFTRHYHSLGFFEPRIPPDAIPAGRHSENRFAFAWRSNFDKRVMPVTVYAPYNITTALTLPSGEVQYFNSAGTEFFNYRGAAGTLVTVAGGYYYKGPEDTEFYGTDGRLQSITTRTGQTLTLTYSDGTSGPNGGFAVDTAGNPTSVILPANLLIRVTDSYGNVLSLSYDPSGRAIVMTDPGGGRYIYTYDVSTNLTSVKDPDNRTRTYRYNEPANIVGGGSLPHALTSIVDENGVVWANYKYTSSDARAVSTEHAGTVNQYLLTYNADSTTSVTDPLGTARTFGFLTQGGISRFTGASLAGGAGYGVGVQNRTYDANANVASQTDFNAIKTCYAYDTVRNLETVRVEGVPSATSCSTVTGSGASLPAGSRKILTEWHVLSASAPRWGLPVRTSEPGRRTTYVYNGDTYQGSPVTCAPAGAIITDGSPSGQPIGVLCTKIVQATTDISDGAQGFNATLVGSPRTWAYTYEAHGNTLTSDGARTDVADVTTYTYYGDTDPDQTKRGNLATVTNAASHATNLTAYNAHGQPLTISDPNSLSTALTYDVRQRLKSRSVGGELTSYDYDYVGELTKVTLPDGSFLSYSYDPAHRLTAMQDNLGNRIAYTLDAMGNRTQEQVFDPGSQLAQTRSRVYSNLNRLFQELGAASQTTEYGYDNHGNVTSVKDPLNQITGNQYDALNRLKQVTDPGTGVTLYAYNGLDALTSVTDPRTLATSYTVDGLGNLNQQASPDTGTTVNTYDAAGNLATQTDAKNQVTTYAYDALNRVTLITFHDGSKQTYVYDQGTNGLGRLTSIEERNPSNQVVALTQYGYDQKGRVTSETRTVNSIAYPVAYSYDSSGRLSGMTYPSGSTATYGFDSLGRVNQVTTTKDAQSLVVVQNVQYHPFGGVKSFTLGNGQVYSRTIDTDGRIASYTLGAANYTIGFDAASRITGIAETGNPPNTNTYGYDALDRLTSAILPSNTLGYGYDAVGNRQTKTVGAATDTYTYGSASNRISTITPASGPVRNFVFDPAGSTTNDGLNSYAYDTRGRMRQATGSLGATDYQVNALGQRIRKTNSSGDTVYQYDSRGRLIAEGTAAGVLRREYLYLGDIPVGVVIAP